MKGMANRSLKAKKGEIYYADLDPVVGSEQGGCRPVLIIQNDIGNRFAPTVIAIAITLSPKKSTLPTHLVLQKEYLEYWVDIDPGNSTVIF